MHSPPPGAEGVAGCQISMDYDTKTKSMIFFGTGDCQVNNDTWALSGTP
jgi:hypothetical protein